MEDIEAGQKRGWFKRINICLKPVKTGYKAGCRPVIGLDGFHLKGPYGGCILTAMGIDPEDGMYHKAWSVLDAENIDNWCYFLRKLKDDLNINNDGTWTFISDKQNVTYFCNLCYLHLFNLLIVLI